MKTEEIFDSLYQLTRSIAQSETMRLQRDVSEYTLIDQIPETIDEMVAIMRDMLTKRFMRDLRDGKC